MLFALSKIDYSILGLYLLAMVAVGVYFSREQQTSKDFFLAGRSMGWFPVGLSIMATLLSALSYSGVPGESYYAGYKFLIMPAIVWLTMPLMIYYILPLYHGLNLYSVYEYLELRFDAPTRFVSSLIFIVWRLLWLGGVLYAPCKVLVVAAGLDIPMWRLLLLLGLVSTAYTFLGGMKAVIWTDVIQAIVMVSGVVLIVGGVWWSLDGGASRVWEVAQSLQRSETIEAKFQWDSRWSIWGIAPHMAFSMLSFYIADQITVQRYLTAKNLREARRSFLLNCVSVSIMIPALMYVGVSLLAFYHDHPQAIPAKWVANVEVEEKRSMTYADRDRYNPGNDSSARDNSEAPDVDPDRPLIDWRDDQLDASTIEQLVGQRRILKPNSKQPFTSAEELIDPQTGQLIIDRLAARYPPQGTLQRGEVVLNKRARDELMPRFITKQLPIGVAGLIMAALFAASMSSMDSGLNSICTLLIMDFHRRLGWGRQWLAARLKKSSEDLTEEDELKLGRPMVLIIGVAATLFSLLVAQVGDIFNIMVAVVNTFGAPLLAVFLLGIFSRRCTAKGALAALLLGALFTLWLMAANAYPQMAWLWPWEQKINGVWPVTFGVLFSVGVGYLVSLVTGDQKTNQELRGLALGAGELGKRSEQDSSVDLGEIDLKDGPDDRWK